MISEFSSQKLLQYQGLKILGLDIGSKKTGAAIFTPGREPFPIPLCIFQTETEEKLLKGIKDLIDEESAELVIVGIPYFTDGKESEMTHKVQNIAKLIQTAISPIPLLTQDETLSSFEAEERMKASPQYNFKIDKNRLDALAASIILEDFFRK